LSRQAKHFSVSVNSTYASHDKSSTDLLVFFSYCV
jgi:hypothetical protein